MRVRFVVFLFLLGCSKKELAIGDQKLTVPPGCTSESTSRSGKISCTETHSQLTWLRVDGDGTAELDKDEGIIREAFTQSKNPLVVDQPKCTFGGADARCRRVRLSKVTLAVMGIASSDGKKFFVECAYDPNPANNAPPPACNGLLSVRE